MAGEETGTAVAVPANGAAPESGAPTLSSLAAELFDSEQAFEGGEPVAVLIDEGTDEDGDGGAPEGTSDAGTTTADPVAAWRESEDGKAFARKLKRDAEDSLQRDVRRALQGDEDAIKALQNSRAGRKVWGDIQQGVNSTATRVAQTRTVAEQEFTRLQNATVWEREQEFAARPGLANWYYTDMPAYLSGAATVSGATTQAETVATSADTLDDEYADLIGADEAKGLTEDEIDSFHPSNYDDLAPTKARAAMAKQYAKVIAAAATREARRPVRDKAEQVDKAGRVIDQAMRNAPPVVGGSPPQQESEAVIEARWAKEYNAGHLTPQTDAAWKAIKAARAARPGQWSP